MQRASLVGPRQTFPGDGVAAPAPPELSVASVGPCCAQREGGDRHRAPCDPTLGPFQERKSYKWKQLLFFFTFITFAFAVCVYFHHNWYCSPGGKEARAGPQLPREGDEVRLCLPNPEARITPLEWGWCPGDDPSTPCPAASGRCPKRSPGSWGRFGCCFPSPAVFPSCSLHHLCLPGVPGCSLQHGLPHDCLLGLRQQGAGGELDAGGQALLSGRGAGARLGLLFPGRGRAAPLSCCSQGWTFAVELLQGSSWCPAPLSWSLAAPGALVQSWGLSLGTLEAGPPCLGSCQRLGWAGGQRRGAGTCCLFSLEQDFAPSVRSRGGQPRSAPNLSGWSCSSFSRLGVLGQGPQKGLVAFWAL